MQFDKNGQCRPTCPHIVDIMSCKAYCRIYNQLIPYNDNGFDAICCDELTEDFYRKDILHPISFNTAFFDKHCGHTFISKWDSSNVLLECTSCKEIVFETDNNMETDSLLLIRHAGHELLATKDKIICFECNKEIALRSRG